jgi:hypothetical protein
VLRFGGAATIAAGQDFAAVAQARNDLLCHQCELRKLLFYALYRQAASRHCSFQIAGISG